MRESITESDQIIEQGKEKDALSFILSNSFRSGFGTLSKSELDLILFAALLKFGAKEKTSDHELSLLLQVTQRRIRNLKENVSVKYFTLSRDEAIKRFVEKAKYASLSEPYINIPINDIAVKNEIEAVLDESNILLHSQLNPKIFRIRIDDFLELSIQLERSLNKDESSEVVEKRILDEVKKLAEQDKKLKNQLVGKSGAGLGSLTKSTLKEAMVKGGLSFGIELLVSLIPGGSFVSATTRTLLNLIKGNL